MQQFLESAPLGQPLIAVDQRESPLFDEALKALGAKVDRRRLDVGDFICSSRLVVERKTRSDFEQSVIDGRLFAQLPNLVANYERVVILVEGTKSEERLKRSSLLGAYTAIIADFGASLVFTRDMEASAELLFHMARHEQVSKKGAMRVYARKKTLTPSQTSRAVIESLPMVGPKLAKALLRHFGNAENVLSANERELSEVAGMGRKRAAIMKRVLSLRYDESEDKSMY